MFHGTQPTRAQSGILGSLILSLVLLIGLAIGSFGLDVWHLVHVKADLQNACDAAAMAGAQDLTKSYANVEARARAVAALNKANGKSVSSSTPGTTVTVNVVPSGLLSNGSVTVTATMAVPNLFGVGCGRSSDNITTRSIATASGKLNTVYPGQVFPLAVSLDAIPTSLLVPRTPLALLNVGDTLHLYLNSQQVKNAAFTSFTLSSSNAEWLNNAIPQALGLSTMDISNFPELHVGDTINLMNGIDGQMKLAQNPQYSALLAQPIIVLPVVLGTPPFNQSTPIVGYVGIKVTNVTLNNAAGQVETITGTIVKAVVKGAKGTAIPTGNILFDNALGRFGAGKAVLAG